jgi:hypothetical protein
MRRIKIFAAIKRMIIYFLIFSGTTYFPRINITNADIIFDPFMPPFKIQIAEIPSIATIIIGVTNGLTIFLNLTKQ